MRTRVVAGGACALLLVSSLAGFAGYQAARGEPVGREVSPGGPTDSVNDLNTWARAEASHGIWIHPGVRNLDPFTFGTVSQPLGFQFMIGIPVYDRLDNGQGQWTTTALATPASNITTPLAAKSEARLEVYDRTPRDQPTFTSPTMDAVQFSCSFTDPAGRAVTISCNEPLPRGPFHEFFGGVGTNMILHGRTGIGAMIVPQAFAYAAFWGKGEIRIDGQLLPGNDNRLVHVMVVEGVRDANNTPGLAGGNGPFLAATQAEVDRNDLELHVLLPDVRFVPNPVPNSPVFGFSQPFIHLLFEDVILAGSAINGVLHR